MREADKMDAAVKGIMASHATADIKGEDAEAARAARTVERLKAEAAKIRAWLEAHPDERRSAKGKPDPLWDRRKVVKKTPCLRPADFTRATDRSHCVGPAGNKLYSNGSNCTFNGYAAMKFRGAERDCVPCVGRDQWLRAPDKRVCAMSGTGSGDTSINACDGKTPTTEDERMTDSG